MSPQPTLTSYRLLFRRFARTATKYHSDASFLDARPTAA
ncbi:hypothetical protein A2U01_0037616, partial [Trifolium medium]|nr:hypothetical protein [Trifolium medium]